LVPVRQDPRPVFRALDLCLKRSLIPRAELEVVFLGTRPESVKAVLSEDFNDLPISVLPRQPHRSALALQTQASVLLLLAHASERGIMTGKIFDYLAANRPILAVPDDRNTTALVLKSTGAGVAITEVESIVRQLSEWYAQWRVDPTFNLTRDQNAISSYSRPAQAGRLAELLNEQIADQLPSSR